MGRPTFAQITKTKRLAIAWWILHIGIALTVGYSAVLLTHDLLAKRDNKPVYVVKREPVVLTPYINPGDVVAVEWIGRYRKACGNLEYTRWLCRFVDGAERCEKFPRVQSSSERETKISRSVFEWRIPHWVDPGIYFWRSIEIAECDPGVAHRNHLDDAYFEVISADIDPSEYRLRGEHDE